MRRLFLYLTLLMALPVCAQLASTRDTISILFGGDAMGHSPQFQWAYNAVTDSYDYEPCFRYIRPYVKSADLAVVNLEVTLAGLPYSGYPNFSTPDAYFYSLCANGFDVMMLANNHILDRGRRGLERTLNVIGDVPNMGAYRDSLDRARRYPLIMEVQGLRVAFFNCTYGCNGYFPIAPNMVNFIDTVQISRDLMSIRDSAIDLRIMCIHWGIEYQLQAVPVQKEVATWLASMGFDAVIGGHPHVVENAEYIDSVPVFYSLGNLISNQRRENTNGGILVRVDIARASHKIIGVSYLPCYVHKGTLSYRQSGEVVTERQYFLIPTTDYLNGHYPFRLADADEHALRHFHELTTKRLENIPLLK